MIELGDKVRDPITGFVGVAVAKTEYIHACDEITVQSSVNEKGEVPEEKGFDLPRLDLLKREFIASGAHGPVRHFSMIKPGDKVTDPVTQYSGIVVALTHYLYGCSEVSVQGRVNGKYEIPDWEVFDARQVKRNKKGAELKGDQEYTPPPPARRHYAGGGSGKFNPNNKD